MGGTLLPQSSSWCPSTQGVWEERQTLKTVAKKLLPLPSPHLFLPVFQHCFSSGSTLIFSGLHVVDALLVILYIPYQVQFQLHLDPPHPISTQSYFISILFPGCLSLFPCPCICFFPFSLTRSSQLCHTDLSFPLTSFSLLGIASSCAPWKTSLKICQLCSALLPLREVLQGTLKRWKFVFLKSCNTVFAVGL